MSEFDFLEEQGVSAALIKAAEEFRQEYGVSEEKAESEIKRINHNRIAHYEYYTGEKWGEPHHYNLMINTGSIDLSVACNLIKSIYKNRIKENLSK